MRFERETMLSEQSQKMTGSDIMSQEILLLDHNSDLIKTSNMKKFKNSSFLSRCEETLSKIAQFISHKDDDVTNLSSHGDNSMSFMTVEISRQNRLRKESWRHNKNRFCWINCKVAQHIHHLN
jgi:hypothetical protein